MASKIPEVLWVRWVKPLALYGILWAGFHLWLNFDNTQSMVFAFLFGSCYFAFREINRKTEKAEDVIPYQVSVNIHDPRSLLFKLKFIKTEEDWKQVCERTKDTSILRRGLNFTVLSLSKEGLPHLIWWDDHKMFFAGLPSFEEAMQGLELPNEDPISKEMGDKGWSPSLYFGFRHGKGHGYNVALCVNSSWWEKNKTSGELEIDEDEDYLTGSTYLIVGTLPYGEIGLDYEARNQERKAELEKLGWTIKDYQDPEISEFSRIEVQNKYASVTQRWCETG
jgi:hypothetical protein